MAQCGGLGWLTGVVLTGERGKQSSRQSKIQYVPDAMTLAHRFFSVGEETVVHAAPLWLPVRALTAMRQIDDLTTALTRSWKTMLM